MKYPISHKINENDKFILSDKDIMDNLFLLHSNFMAIYIPDEEYESSWSIIYANHSVGQINRLECPFGLDMIHLAKSTVDIINNKLLIYEIISHVIDSIHHSPTLLYDLVVKEPEKSGELIKERLTSLGYHKFMDLQWETMNISELKQNVFYIILD